MVVVNVGVKVDDGLVLAALCAHGICFWNQENMVWLNPMCHFMWHCIYASAGSD